MFYRYRFITGKTVKYLKIDLQSLDYKPVSVAQAQFWSIFRGANDTLGIQLERTLGKSEKESFII